MKKRLFLITTLCIAAFATAFCQKTTTTAPKGKTPVQTRPQVQGVNKSSTAHTTVVSNARMDNKDGLPDFEKSGGKPFLDILRDKESICSLTPEALDSRTISMLLWAACGKTNAPESYTALYISKKPCIDIYVIIESGIYKYDYNEHKLLLVKHGHFMNLLNNQGNEHNPAPMALFYTYNPEEIEFASETGVDMKEMIVGINCGAIMQNVSLFCSSENLSCTQISLTDTQKEQLRVNLHNASANIIYAQAVSKR